MARGIERKRIRRHSDLSDTSRLKKGKRREGESSQLPVVQ